jgi:nucleoside-diphosphate-sugar epimerase
MRAVIFGGSGFIGTFFAQYLIETQGASDVFLYDCEAVNEKPFSFRKKLVDSYPQITVVEGDVTKPIEWDPSGPIDLVANFAAVHREPGHADHEYYECNLLGAENVCAWTARVGCKKILFSSSIAPYGVSEEEKDEQSVPVPTSAYGGSKLAAEKIHQVWQVSDPQRQLVIVRPGVVFGPGEGGNVTRLIKAVRKHYFFYMGNKKTRKAGVYVKELCRAMIWVLNSPKAQEEKFTIFNMSMNPAPSVEEYVTAISSVSQKRVWVPTIPHLFILSVAYAIDMAARPLGIQHPFSPVRINKLVRSNNILPGYLQEQEYEFEYALESAFVDWMAVCPEEWE